MAPAIAFDCSGAIARPTFGGTPSVTAQHVLEHAGRPAKRDRIVLTLKLKNRHRFGSELIVDRCGVAHVSFCRVRFLRLHT